MTILPLQIDEVMPLYNREIELKPSGIFESEDAKSNDILNISSDARKRQILEQAKSEVLEKIRGTK